MTTFGDGVYQWGGVPVSSGVYIPKNGGRAWFVDGTNGLDGNSGKSPSDAFASITQAVTTNTELQEFDTIYVFPKTMAATDTDPGSYAETVTISTPQISIVGVGHGPVQANLPQVKIGAGTTAMFTIAAPGITIENMGFNGASSTGGGIKINEAPSGIVIRNCHFKNCKCHATNGGLGGAIYWSSSGGGWQVLIEGNRFYKNVADIVVIGTGSSVPQDVVIRGNIFAGPAANVDVNILTGGSGVNGLIITDNVFQCVPNIGSGSNATILKLTGSVGVLAKNFFGAAGEAFGAAQANVVPTTMLLAGNWSEDGLEARV